MLAKAIVFITLALIFYTVGVFGEKSQKVLKKWNVIIFWMGFICDTLGTKFMGDIAGSMFQINIHGITGIMAILLMLFHALWATIVFINNNEETKKKFHKFSIFVWIIWLIPYISGMIIGISR